MATQLVPNMVLDIVMHSAPTTLNSLTVVLTSSTGIHPPMIQIVELENGEPAALKWIFGKPTKSPQLSLFTHVKLLLNTNALLQRNAVIAQPTDLTHLATVIRM